MKLPNYSKTLRNTSLVDHMRLSHFRCLVEAISGQNLHHVSHEKYLQIAIIGAPNVGKSSLTNQLVKAQVCAISSKMDTTLENSTATITQNDTQLAFVDSPGLIGIQHARKVTAAHIDKLLQGPVIASDKADHLIVVQNPMDMGDYIHHRVLHVLHTHSHIPSILVINKLDLVQRRSELLELVRILCNDVVGGKPIKTTRKQIGLLGYLQQPRSSDSLPFHAAEMIDANEKWQIKYRAAMAKKTYESHWQETKHLFANIRGWSNFDSVFFVSCLTGEGIEGMRNHLCSLAETKNHHFHRKTVTTKNPQNLCSETIRAQLLDHLPSDIAYSLKVVITEWQIEGDVLQIVAEVRCKNDRYARLVLGKSGGTIISIGKNTNDIMQNLFSQQLFIRILVKANGKLVDLNSS